MMSTTPAQPGSHDGPRISWAGLAGALGAMGLTLTVGGAVVHVASAAGGQTERLQAVERKLDSGEEIARVSATLAASTTARVSVVEAKIDGIRDDVKAMRDELRAVLRSGK